MKSTNKSRFTPVHQAVFLADIDARGALSRIQDTYHGIVTMIPCFFFEKDLFSELKYRPRKEVTDNSIEQNGCEDFGKTTFGPSCFPQVRGWIHEGSISAEKLPTQEKFTKIPVVKSPKSQQ